MKCKGGRNLIWIWKCFKLATIIQIVVGEPQHCVQTAIASGVMGGTDIQGNLMGQFGSTLSEWTNFIKLFCPIIWSKTFPCSGPFHSYSQCMCLLTDNRRRTFQSRGDSRWKKLKENNDKEVFRKDEGSMNESRTKLENCRAFLALNQNCSSINELMKTGMVIDNDRTDLVSSPLWSKSMSRLVYGVIDFSWLNLLWFK